MSLEMETGNEPIVDIKIVGVGGAGGNAINHMIESGVAGAEYLAVNTDKQALDISKAGKKIQIGSKITEGQGAGANPMLGLQAAEESRGQIANEIKDADILFVTAGMGGGTGTGAAPVLSGIAKDLGILTVGVVTKPFNFEGRRRMMQAEKGIETLLNKVDSLVIIPNERLKYVSEQKITLSNAFDVADDVLRQAVQAISDIINNTGFINMDFADVTAVMKNAGLAHMGIGRAAGQHKAEDAAHRAISSPLLETNIQGARGILVNVTGSTNMGLEEVEIATNLIQEAADPDALFIFGATFDESLSDEIVVTVIATGFSKEEGTGKPALRQQAPASPTRRQDPIETAAPASPEPEDTFDDDPDDDPFKEIFKIFDRRK